MATAGCFQCGLPVAEPGRWRVLVLGAEREFCCAGCEAVARAITGAGLERYYETRTQVSERAAAQEEARALALLDDPVAARQFVAAEGERRSATLLLERVRCAACLWLVEQWLRRQPGVLRAHVNHATRRAVLEWDVRQTRLSRLIEALRAIGYDAWPFDPARADRRDRDERRTALWRLFVAALGAMQVMMYALPPYFDPHGTLAPENAQLLRWASLALTLPVVLISAQPFFAGARADLAARRIGLDVPIALGIAVGFTASAWATISATGEVYFDSIAMLVFLLLAARWVEGVGRARAARGLDRLGRWMPDFALRVVGERSERVAAAALAPGERVLVAPGERVPADGVVEQGFSSADESLLTGEALAVAKRPGDRVIAGSVNVEHPLVVRVERAGAETAAAALVRLVERAAASRPRLVAAADRLARHLTAVVLATAALAAAAWWPQDPSAAVWIAVAILVVTCPCALALAAPIALTAAGARLLEQGVALARSQALEALAGATDVVFDKTGTLTTGRLALVRTVPLGPLPAERLLALARRLEATSRHPIAAAFGPAQAAPPGEATHFPGAGIEAVVEGERLRIGSAAFCAELAGGAPPAAEPPTARGSVWLARAGAWLARFDLEDEARADARAAIAALERAGLEVHLASGDEPRAVEAFADRLGMARRAGGLSPQQKYAFVARLQAEGRRVVMVGDGLNDAPVLARADVSVAMAGGADLARVHADLVLVGDRLGALARAHASARAAMRIVRQNFAWALGYNALALPAAALGWIGPWEAAIGMAASSFIVVLNALRLAQDAQSPRPWKASLCWSPSPSRSSS